MNINTSPAEGMRDLLPKEVDLRNYVSNIIIGSYKKFGFTQIETPCVERINLLSSGDGGENEKMLFKILKRGEKLNLSSNVNEMNLVDLGLRYDLTVPLCRFYSNNKSKLPNPFKVIQVGSVWRAERPQRGRYRQFTQCDIDILGVGNVISEIELILATSEALEKIGFRNFRVRINDRRILESLARFCDFDEKIFGKVFIALDKLDKIGVLGVRKELEELNLPFTSIDKFMDIISLALEEDFGIERVINILPNIPQPVIDDLQEVINVISLQSNNNYIIKLDLSLVRGMGYYTGQIFEIEIPGYKSSVAGGGRYDKMIGKILKSKEEIPACGFSIGFERVISILQERDFIVPDNFNRIAILYSEELKSYQNLLIDVQSLRDDGNIVSLVFFKKKKAKNQIDMLIENGFSHFAIYQEGEPLKLKEVNLKQNATGNFPI